MIRHDGMVVWCCVGTALITAAAMTRNGTWFSGSQAYESSSLKVGGVSLVADIARTPREWARGMMYRDSDSQSQAMLFVFDAPMTACFWMKNTAMPLDVLFIDANAKIISSEQMHPYSLDQHCASQPVKFALEVRHGILPNDALVSAGKIGGLPSDY